MLTKDWTTSSNINQYSTLNSECNLEDLCIQLRKQQIKHALHITNQGDTQSNFCIYLILNLPMQHKFCRCSCCWCYCCCCCFNFFDKNWKCILLYKSNWWKLDILWQNKPNNAHVPYRSTTDEGHSPQLTRPVSLEPHLSRSQVWKLWPLASNSTHIFTQPHPCSQTWLTDPDHTFQALNISI